MGSTANHWLSSKARARSGASSNLHDDGTTCFIFQDISGPQIISNSVPQPNKQSTQWISCSEEVSKNNQRTETTRKVQLQRSSHSALVWNAFYMFTNTQLVYHKNLTCLAELYSLFIETSFVAPTNPQTNFRNPIVVQASVVLSSGWRQGISLDWCSLKQGILDGWRLWSKFLISCWQECVPAVRSSMLSKMVDQRSCLELLRL